LPKRTAAAALVELETLTVAVAPAPTMSSIAFSTAVAKAEQSDSTAVEMTVVSGASGARPGIELSSATARVVPIGRSMQAVLMSASISAGVGPLAQAPKASAPAPAPAMPKSFKKSRRSECFSTKSNI